MNIGKVITIAIREFLATAATKAFIFGTLALPAIGGIMLLLNALGAFKTSDPKAEGTILVADGTDTAFVASGLEAAYSPEAIRAAREAVKEKTEEMLKNIPIGGENEKEMSAEVVANQAVPSVHIERIAPGDDFEAAKSRVKDNADDAFLLFVVSERSVEIPPTDADLDGLSDDEQSILKARGAFEIYQNQDTRPQIVENVRRQVQDLIVNERIVREGLDPARISELRRFPTVEARTLTDAGEADSQNNLAQILPFVFFMLLWISVMSGGQYLLMSTIEEKSTRVMEVLLSAISPRELLVGKIIGQGAVGLLILLIYGGMGVFAADHFNVLSLIPARLLLMALVYFFIAYAFFASLMAAAGSAVSDIREASALTSPIMMLLMLPFFLWVPITQNPEGIIAVVTSFIPPLTPFVMVLRMCQPGVEIPMWELIATTGVALLGVLIMVYAAVKIFRVGVLMYGKPPSFVGLLKWIRYA